MARRASPQFAAATILALLAVAALGQMRLHRLAREGYYASTGRRLAQQAGGAMAPRRKPPHAVMGISADAGSSKTAEPSSQSVAELRDGGRLDINGADTSALQLLPGIGPTLAQRILAHRREHGPFPHLDALAAVPGIGPKTLEKLRSTAKASAPKAPK